MSLHYLLDGYNIIKQTARLNHGTLEDQRKSLLLWIETFVPQGSQQNTVTIVFDGKEEFFGSQSTISTKVVFAKGRGQSADDLIKKIVEQYPSKRNLVVVSDDKDIKLYVRALGSQVLSVKDFTKVPLRRHSKSSKIQASDSEKNISLVQQAKITKELEGIWINRDHQ